LAGGLGILSLALALFFFARSEHLKSTPYYGGVFESGAAALFALFAAAALILLGLSRIVERKSAGASIAATVVGIICGSIPLALVASFSILQNLG